MNAAGLVLQSEPNIIARNQPVGGPTASRFSLVVSSIVCVEGNVDEIGLFFRRVPCNTGASANIEKAIAHWYNDWS
jgi:hypothetical protein